MKQGITFGIALMCVIFVTACDTISDTGAIQPGNGYGKISVNLAGEESPVQTARTVLPSKVFDKYVYTFTRTGETGGTEKTPDSAGFFMLEIGNYTVEVQAYTGDEDAYTLAASGVSAQFSVGPGINAPVAVRLVSAIAGACGKFSYTITYPETFDEAAISLQKWPELSDIALNPAFLVEGNGKIQTLQLLAGSYLLTILVHKDEMYAGISEAVHIKPSFVTVYSKNFTENDLLGSVSVTNAEIIVIAPVKGAAPQMSASGGGDSAISRWNVGPVSWSPEDDIFLGSTVYTATLMLTANTGYTFTGLSNASINGQGAQVMNNTGTSVTLSLAFPPTNEKTVAGIAIKTQPDKLTYAHGDTLDLSGLVVTLIYDDFTTEDAAAADFSAKNITANPAPGNSLAHLTHNGQPITITYGDLPPQAAGNLTVSPRVITFDVDPVPDQTYTNNTGVPITPAVVVKDGAMQLKLNADYTAAYSNNTSAGTATVTINGMGNYAGSTGSVTFSILYKIVFNINGGIGTTPASQTVPAGSDITLPDGSGLSITGYTFDGWNTSNNGSGTNYNGGDSFAPQDGGYITLYARWLRTVTFDINGGTGTVPAPQAYYANSAGIALPGGSGFSRTGYTFAGWNTSANGRGTNYSAGSSYTPSGDITLYARWVYTVTFDINGGTGTTPASLSNDVGYSITLPNGSSFSRSGYTFGGWNTLADGSGTNYNAGSSYTSSGGTTLYAKWNIKYTVTFNINNGTGTIPAPREGNADSSITLPGGSGFSRSGYTFGGWNTLADGSGTTYSANSSYTPSGATTLYAKWNVLHTVSFNTNGGTGTAPASLQGNNDSRITLPGGSGLSKVGYTFGGWNTSPNGTGNNYISFYAPSGDITLYAKWNVLYTVTFNINNGTGTPPASLQGNNDSPITLPNGSGFSRSGYTFGGWNTDASGTGNDYNAGASYPPTGDITLYAKWNVLYTVTFSINNGTGTTPVSQTGNGGSAITLPSDYGFSRTGYTFNCWNTLADGSGINYIGGAAYTVNGNVTLYAKWNPLYTVTFNINNGTGTAPPSLSIEAGYSITIPDGSGFSRTGYTFSGWNTNASGTGTNYNAGSSYKPDANVTLYAKWTPLSITITFDINGGSGTTPASQTGNGGSAITLPGGSGLSKAGYTFGGWNTSANGSGTNYSAGSSYTLTSSTTLYAKWNALHTVYFNANGGTGTPPGSQTGNADSPITLPGGSGLSKTGYGFSGWNTSANGSGTTFSAGFSYQPSGTITLYAKWDIYGSEGYPIPLARNSRRNGEFTSNDTAFWYSFDVTSGRTYHVSWEDSGNYNRDEPRPTMDVKVSAYYSDGAAIFVDVDIGYPNPQEFIAATSGTVKVKVTRFSSWLPGSIGTFKLIYY